MVLSWELDPAVLIIAFFSLSISLGAQTMGVTMVLVTEDEGGIMWRIVDGFREFFNRHHECPMSDFHSDSICIQRSLSSGNLNRNARHEKGSAIQMARLSYGCAFDSLDSLGIEEVRQLGGVGLNALESHPMTTHVLFPPTMTRNSFPFSLQFSTCMPQFHQNRHGLHFSFFTRLLYRYAGN